VVLKLKLKLKLLLGGGWVHGARRQWMAGREQQDDDDKTDAKDKANQRRLIQETAS